LRIDRNYFLTFVCFPVAGPNGSLLLFGVQMFNAPGEYWRTKVVQLSNRYILVNATGRPLLYGQVGAAQEFVLRPDTQVCILFFWRFDVLRVFKKLVFLDAVSLGRLI
jgi:hypothetical protein